MTDRFSKMDGYFDGTLGSDPVRQDRPHHGLDLSTLEGAVLIPKSDCRNNTARDEMRRLAARRLPGVGFLESGTSHGKSVHWGLSRGCNTTARAFAANTRARETGSTDRVVLGPESGRRPVTVGELPSPPPSPNHKVSEGCC